MKLLREPLVHFLALGGLLFVVFAVADHLRETPVPPNRIYVSARTMENLEAGFRKNSGRAPDAAEKQRLVDGYVREEVLVREARAMGLDREDPVVRGELRRRVEQQAEQNATVAMPSEAELGAFLSRHAKDFAAADGHVPPLAEIRAAVVERWQGEQRKAAVEAAYQEMRGRYEVVVEPPPGAGPKSP
jgi:peptidyl-prolyl cis-trans isomerase C